MSSAMQGSRTRHCRRWVARLVGGFLLAALAASPMFGLPKGYQEDFEGCRDRSKDAQDRERCCTETALDCLEECKRILESTPEGEKDYDAAIRCQGGCTAASEDCKFGPKKEAD
jgi:hypothetical protein